MNNVRRCFFYDGDKRDSIWGENYWEQQTFRSASKSKMTTVNSQVRQMADIDLGPGLCKLLIGDTAHSRRLGTKFSLTLKFNQHSISNNKTGKEATKSNNKKNNEVCLTVVEDLSSVRFVRFEFLWLIEAATAWNGWKDTWASTGPSNCLS